MKMHIIAKSIKTVSLHDIWKGIKAEDARGAKENDGQMLFWQNCQQTHIKNWRHTYHRPCFPKTITSSSCHTTYRYGVHGQNSRPDVILVLTLECAAMGHLDLGACQIESATMGTENALVLFWISAFVKYWRRRKTAGFCLGVSLHRIKYWTLFEK